MKKLILTVSLLSLAIAEVHADDVFTDAVKAGKATFQVRPRFEFVDDAGAATADPAKAFIVRTVLGYKLAPIAGITAYAEAEDIRALGDDYHVPVVQAKPAYATVVDPEGTAVNQAWLAGYGFKVGKQKVVYNNARFIGDVGFRQDDQTFTAISYEKAKLLSWLDVQASYANKVAMINGQDGDISLPIVNLKARTPLGANVTLFWAGLEGKEAAGLTVPAAGLLANTGKDKSREYRVLKIDGKKGKFLYDLSYGKQSAYADGTAANAPDAEYRDIQLGYDFGPVLVKIQQETLEQGFQTPLATLHAFNGWADRFLATPTGGLVDTNIKLSGKAAGLGLALAVHRFEAESGGKTFGNEIDASVSKTFTPQWSAMVKVAKYNGSDEITAPANQVAYSKDVLKAWAQVEYKF
ncbi:MAG: hypothetical protein AABY68_10875 [Pseudomonadota bacterium]